MLVGTLVLALVLREPEALVGAEVLPVAVPVLVQILVRVLAQALALVLAPELVLEVELEPELELETELAGCGWPALVDSEQSASLHQQLRALVLRYG